MAAQSSSPFRDNDDGAIGASGTLVIHRSSLGMPVSGVWASEEPYASAPMRVEPRSEVVRLPPPPSVVPEYVEYADHADHAEYAPAPEIDGSYNEIARVIHTERRASARMRRTSIVLGFALAFAVGLTASLAVELSAVSRPRAVRSSHVAAGGVHRLESSDEAASKTSAPEASASVAKPLHRPRLHDTTTRSADLNGRDLLSEGLGN